ncbi:hypothetical protein JR316_0000903 [Psilocybe cubensis]|uniref:Uncharacterized protein n=1 Tax=Psilocybe cubensis TaxID=181762 RepID=A0ACB8HGA5_PSICU|nr:hypothetical protein JR316_0000903 [Psilocybe cubensis]KAH9486838.1 hypothetical protein JR316_0000903 [Psilocybe cubensis]
MSINRKNRYPQGPRHVSGASLDTNASGIAESTISLGLSRFPEPPSSIPSTPLRTNFEAASPSRIAFGSPSLSPISPLRRAPPPPPPPRVPVIPSTDPSPSLDPITASSSHPVSLASQPASSSASAVDWNDGASSIGLDAAEDRLLPTSFITSLLQENKELRKNKRSSYSSDAFSGISEMTYPPIVNRPESSNSRYVSGKPGPNQRLLDSRSPPPSSFPRPSKASTKSSNRQSDGSDTLHSIQGYPSIGKVVNGNTSGGMYGPAPPYSKSASSQLSAGSMGSVEKGYQNKLSTAYEGDEQILEYAKAHDWPVLTEAQRRSARDDTSKDPLARDSVHSLKSMAPSFMSKISGISLRHILPWRRVKPLPPVPLIPNMTLAAQNAQRKEEETAPLPDLVNRADILREMLDNGHRPYDSSHNSVYQSLPNPAAMRYDQYEAEARRLGFQGGSVQTTSIHVDPSPTVGRRRTSALAFASTKKKRMYFIISVVLIAILAAIGTGVGISIGKKKSSQPSCTDATCVCTSTSGCNGLAQALIDLIPIVNQQLQANFTASSVYSNIWMMQGSPTTNNCASQAILVDVGKGLDQVMFPNRTQWARAAMMWNAVQTQDMDSAQKMTQFVQSRPWNDISSSDGPTANSGGAFSATLSGYNYDFAAQTVTQPSGSFAALSQASKAQISRVSSTAQAALDRMYSIAQASSIQQQTALKKYWTSVLLQRASDLPTFKSAFSVAPILLPFNASAPSIRNLYSSSPSSLFPPPLSCYPGLSSSALQQINSVETSVFGLQAASSASQFDSACYPDRPIYGVLDVLRLRLPFLDTRSGVVREAAVLTRDATSRAVIYKGELLSTLLSGSSSNTAPFTPAQLDPRQFGTISLADHVILQYLSSIPDITITNALVRFILDTATKPPAPPDISSSLYQSLQSIPALEVAIFGQVPPSDLTSTVAPFTNPSGSFFFGSDDASALRNWTINTVSGSVVWTQNATSPLIVRDKSLSNTTITQTWNAISLAITHNIPNIGLANITTTFTNTGDFSIS